MSSWMQIFILFIFIVLVTIVPIDSTKASTTSTKVDLRTKKTNKATTKHIESKLLPKLLPHPDTCYLLEFHHDDCDHAEQMEPVLKRLEDDLDTKVRRININTRKEFFSLLSTVGHDECGSFPFYYNRRTGQAICGATSYSNLRSWGTGEIGHMFHEPPENMHDRESRGAGRKHEVGFKGFFSEKMSRQPKRSGSSSTNSDKQNSKSGKKKASTPATTTTTTTSDVSKGKKAGSDEKAAKPADSKKTKGVAATRMEERKARRESQRTLASPGK